jgi:hypothetical protein
MQVAFQTLLIEELLQFVLANGLCVRVR